MMEEFLDKLISQIRCKKARPYIRDEIKMHIEDQISDNIQSGMRKDEAEKEAIKDMGDPIEVGISLDRIHKPQVAWGMLAIIAIISIIGIILHFSISLHMKQYDGTAISSPLLSVDRGIEFAISVLLGLIVMFLLYLIDYTTIGKYSKIIGSILIITVLYACFFGIMINGRILYITFGPLRVQITALIMFYVPIYGAIIYKYRGGGLGALLKSTLWMVIPASLVFRFTSTMVAGILVISMLVQLTIAIAKGWFKVPVKKTIIIIWITAILLPILCMIFMNPSNLLFEYRRARLRAFIMATEDRFYLTRILRELNSDLALFGGNGKELIGYLPGYNRDYIFSYVLSTYGTFAGILLVVILAALVICIFSSVINQKNQLGCVIGCGCGMIFLMNIIINLLGCMGLIPPTSSFLPFFSEGGSNIILSYALVGIILSIYRYKSIYPQHVSTKLNQKKISING